MEIRHLWQSFLSKVTESVFFPVNYPFLYHSAFAEVFCWETVGLQKILSLLEAEDADVRIHAVKVVANLAAEGVSWCFLSVLSLSTSFIINPFFSYCLSGPNLPSIRSRNAYIKLL